jgi:hypothetical protein
MINNEYIKKEFIENSISIQDEKTASEIIKILLNHSYTSILIKGNKITKYNNHIFIKFIYFEAIKLIIKIIDIIKQINIDQTNKYIIIIFSQHQKPQKYNDFLEQHSHQNDISSISENTWIFKNNDTKHLLFYNMKITTYCDCDYEYKYNPLNQEITTHDILSKDIIDQLMQLQEFTISTPDRLLKNTSFTFVKNAHQTQLANNIESVIIKIPHNNASMNQITYQLIKEFQSHNYQIIVLICNNSEIFQSGIYYLTGQGFKTIYHDLGSIVKISELPHNIMIKYKQIQLSSYEDQIILNSNNPKVIKPYNNKSRMLYENQEIIIKPAILIPKQYESSHLSLKPLKKTDKSKTSRHSHKMNELKNLHKIDLHTTSADEIIEILFDNKYTSIDMQRNNNFYCYYNKIIKFDKFIIIKYPKYSTPEIILINEIIHKLLEENLYILIIIAIKNTLNKEPLYMEIVEKINKVYPKENENINLNDITNHTSFHLLSNNKSIRLLLGNDDINKKIAINRNHKMQYAYINNNKQIVENKILTQKIIKKLMQSRELQIAHHDNTNNIIYKQKGSSMSMEFIDCNNTTYAIIKIQQSTKLIQIILHQLIQELQQSNHKIIVLINSEVGSEITYLTLRGFTTRNAINTELPISELSNEELITYTGYFILKNKDGTTIVKTKEQQKTNRLNIHTAIYQDQIIEITTKINPDTIIYEDQIIKITTKINPDTIIYEDQIIKITTKINPKNTEAITNSVKPIIKKAKTPRKTKQIFKNPKK